ncbi:diaminopimelate epimerase [Alkalibacillus filiformis]|uniref:Diaminopimelate epimerase n=1 Tax=Alkalibacillus filiformis TaxID=200990 RepID=A0ABU0DWZ0_9BACI|nr:diaminopimelate epimerase [Alkalibacillus filiformis]MDQ0352828.1 diaminopimelate epimerase [Alkalibacillus filiformis]
MKVPFTKMHGLGNSYIYIDGFQFELEEQTIPKLAQEVSNVNTGIGSDGLIIVMPSSQADVRMRIFNKDGSEAMNCGNGLRCVAKFAFEHGYVNTEDFKIEAKSGVVDATVHTDEQGQTVNSVSVDMGPPILEREQIPMTTEHGGPNDQVIAEPFEVDEEKLVATAVSMGNPHVIFYEDNIKDAPVSTLGPKVTSDQRFPEGVNVEFVEVVNSREIIFRVWERGSGITQACGTGACAAVVSSVLNGFVKKGEEVTVHLDGGDLWISWLHNHHVLMRGPAKTVVEGVFFSEVT